MCVFPPPDGRTSTTEETAAPPDDEETASCDELFDKMEDEDFVSCICQINEENGLMIQVRRTHTHAHTHAHFSLSCLDVSCRAHPCTRRALTP